MKPTSAMVSGLVLAFGLSAPAWAQLGRVGAGAGANSEVRGNIAAGGTHISTDSSTRVNTDTSVRDTGSLRGSSETSTSTNARVKTKGKANANAEAQARAGARVKKEKKHKNHQPEVQAKSDTTAQTVTAVH